MLRKLNQRELNHVSGGNGSSGITCNSCVLTLDFSGNYKRLNDCPCPNGICDAFPVEDLSGSEQAPICPPVDDTDYGSTDYWTNNSMNGWKPPFPWLKPWFW